MSGWVEFATIKQAVPLLSVLEQYRVAGLRRSGKNQWRGRCPLHGGAGRDAFHVNTAQQLFHCFSCGAGGTVLDLVAALEHCDVRAAAQKLVGWWSAPATSGAGWVVQRQPATITKKTASSGESVGNWVAQGSG
jgi:DNA primase